MERKREKKERKKPVITPLLEKPSTALSPERYVHCTRPPVLEEKEERGKRGGKEREREREGKERGGSEIVFVWEERISRGKN